MKKCLNLALIVAAVASLSVASAGEYLTGIQWADPPRIAREKAVTTLDRLYYRCDCCAVA